MRCMVSSTTAVVVVAERHLGLHHHFEPPGHGRPPVSRSVRLLSAMHRRCLLNPGTARRDARAGRAAIRHSVAALRARAGAGSGSKVAPTLLTLAEMPDARTKPAFVGATYRLQLHAGFDF